MNVSFPKQKILIVDDVPGDIKILGDAFKSDCRVCFTGNGEEALKLAMSEKPPDLILLDIILPGIDGYDVCSQLKARKSTRDIPVIFITVKSDQEDEARALELGAVDYITKPYFLPIVKARVKTHLELKRHRDVLENLSSVDGLTGIPNRRRFDEYFDQEWRSAVRESADLSLIMADIDFFKMFNDTYGHRAGDECLRAVAHALFASVKRPRDFVARYGGEEFVAVMPGTNIEGAIFIAERMRENVGSLGVEHACSPIDDRLTISIGTASTAPARSCSSAVLLEAADQALYKAKREGRNQIRSLYLPLRNDKLGNLKFEIHHSEF